MVGHPYYAPGPELEVGGVSPLRPLPLSGRTLLLLTRQYSHLPGHPSRVYVQPSADVPVASWDYADPAGLQAAYDLGRPDGEAFARTGAR